MKHTSATKRLTVCALSTALGVVLMLLGGMIGIGTYAAPLLVGILLTPVGEVYGRRWQFAVVFAVGLLSLILISDAEQSLCFLAFFGWYPALRPGLSKFTGVLSYVLKFAIFNAAMFAAEAVVYFVFAVPLEGAVMLTVFFLLFNLVFFVYDRALPRIQRMYCQRIKKLM